MTVRALLAGYPQYVPVNYVIIGSDNCLSFIQCQAIIWTNAGVLFIGPLATNFRENQIEIRPVPSELIHLNMSANWQPFCLSPIVLTNHDDVIKWKHFPRNWPFVRGIHRSPVNSPQKGQWRGALMFSLIYVWINGWVNNREAGDLRRYLVHYNVAVMTLSICIYMFQSSHLLTPILDMINWQDHKCILWCCFLVLI